tara:strand:- start:24 stop:665 length:642 start_codon:yes stop_codon:yes gene_type:complete
MKRLILSFLTILALPTAINAFPFGNDVEIKNKVGEKILIKGKTVSTNNLNKNDLINLIDKKILFIKEGIEDNKKNVKYYEEQVKWYKDRIGFGKFYVEGVDRQNESLNRQNTWLKEKKNKLTQLLNQKSSIIQDTNNPDLIHIVSVDFTPVYIDLNNQKRVGTDEKIYCLNKELSKEKINYQQIWIDQSSDSKKQLFKNGLLLSKVCKKYAKF